MATRAEIGSLATTLEELTRRVSSLADAAHADDEETAVELFGIERSLSGALRRLKKLAEPPRN
jgi:HAMP domain-containing protein